MNDHDAFERTVSSWIMDERPGAPSDETADRIMTSVSRTRQLPSWLALMKEPPMRLSSRLAVGSPMARLAAIAAGTLLLALMATGAVIGAATLLAGPALFVVAQDGSGDHETISAAVAAADDGDTVLIRPGTYVEAVVIERDITLTGDGPREAIVIMAPEDGPTSPIVSTAPQADPYAVLLVATEARLSNLTFRGERSQVHVNGGSPTLTNLALESVGVVYAGGASAAGNGMVINGRSTATVSNSTLTAGGPIGIFDRSEPLIEGNTLTDGPGIWGHLGDGSVIRRNTISGRQDHAIGLFGATTAVVEGNTILAGGITVGYGSSPGVDPIIRGNTIIGAPTAISVAPQARPSIMGNVLSDGRIAISMTRSDAEVIENELRGNLGGIGMNGGSPRIEGNTITGGTTGIVLLDPASAPVLAGNTVCHNDRNIQLQAGAQMPDTAGNDICPDDAADVASE